MAGSLVDPLAGRMVDGWVGQKEFLLVDPTAVHLADSTVAQLVALMAVWTAARKAA